MVPAKSVAKMRMKVKQHATLQADCNRIMQQSSCQITAGLPGEIKQDCCQSSFEVSLALTFKRAQLLPGPFES